jgi:hypothetical protein
MLIGRSDDPQTPCRVEASKAAYPFGGGSRNPSGPAAVAPRKQAGHTTAIAPHQFFFSTAPCIEGAVHTHPTVCYVGWTSEAQSTASCSLDRLPRLRRPAEERRGSGLSDADGETTVLDGLEARYRAMGDRRTAVERTPDGA